MKKLFKFLGSMQLAILLLALLAAACIAGSVIAQGLSYEAYSELYSPRTAGLIVALRLDDVFHAWWFLLLTVCLCGNLLLCNLSRLPKLLKRARDAADPALRGQPTVTAEGVADPDAVFARLRMPKPAESTDEAGRALRFSVRSRIGLWGAWICHLGVVLLVIGFAMGQITMEQHTVYGVPGQLLRIDDTDYAVKLRDFRVTREADGFVTQYETDLTVYDMRDEDSILSEDATVGVNSPGSCFGFKLYQNSTGDAAKLTIRRDGALVRESWLCVGDAEQMLDTPLFLQLRAVLPEHGTDAAGKALPGYAYLIYVGDELYTMNIQGEGETIPDFTPYEVSFSEAQSYTLLQIKRDRFAPLAFVGAMIALLGMLLAFYFQTQKLWAVRQEDGSWTVYGQNRKGGVLFADKVRAAVEEGRRNAL